MAKVLIAVLMQYMAIFLNITWLLVIVAQAICELKEIETNIAVGVYSKNDIARFIGKYNNDLNIASWENAVKMQVI